MTEVREDLQLALEADDRERLERIIAVGADSDFDTLQALVATEETPTTFRRRALYALGRWHGKEDTAVVTIESVLPRLEEVERMAAMDALGRIGTSRALDAIVAHVDDPSPEVRRLVAKSLARIGSPRAAEVLAHLTSAESVDYVRQRAEQLLRSSHQP
jgi:HEAT repeat protein